MLNKTIAKFFVFVILTAFLSLLNAACSAVRTGGGATLDPTRYSAPRTIGRIKSLDVIESSGIAASRCQNDVLWTHNDSGDGAYIYAINRSGENLGTWLIPGAENRDWEDLATSKDSSGQCFVYIGEIGDNDRIWPDHAVIRVKEPLVAPSGSNSKRDNALATLPADKISFSYSDGDHDAEALMVHPRTGDVYIVTKRESGPAHVYRLKGDFRPATKQRLTKVAELSLPSVPNGLVTGGDISPDGRRVVLCDYRQAYEFELSETVSDFDEIWRQRPFGVDIGKRKTGEAICYSVDGSEIIATSEGRNPPIVSVQRLK